MCMREVLRYPHVPLSSCNRDNEDNEDNEGASMCVYIYVWCLVSRRPFQSPALGAAQGTRRSPPELPHTVRAVPHMPTKHPITHPSTTPSCCTSAIAR